MLIPSSSSFHSYLSGLIWVFIPSKEFTYFGAFRLITIYSFKKNPSGSYCLYREVISHKRQYWYEISMLLIMDFQNPITAYFNSWHYPDSLYSGTYFVKLMSELVFIRTFWTIAFHHPLFQWWLIIIRTSGSRYSLSDFLFNHNCMFYLTRYESFKHSWHGLCSGSRFSQRDSFSNYRGKQVLTHIFRL